MALAKEPALEMEFAQLRLTELVLRRASQHRGLVGIGRRHADSWTSSDDGLTSSFYLSHVLQSLQQRVCRVPDAISPKRADVGDPHRVVALTCFLTIETSLEPLFLFP
jgi:hypothetical protein